MVSVLVGPCQERQSIARSWFSYVKKRLFRVENMTKIVLSSVDVERIEALVDSLPDSDEPVGMALLDEIKRAEIVDPRNVPDNVVTMNSQVRALIESTGLELSLTLVYPKDIKANGNTVSILAPVGSALLGLSVGDSIDWSGPTGQNIRVRVVELLYQPERNGDYHL